MRTRGKAETIPERIKRLRTEQGLSQRELAQPGVSYAYISRIEAGTREPSVKALRKLAEGLGVEADYLEFGDAGIKKNPTYRAMAKRIRQLEARIRKLERERKDVASLVRSVAQEELKG